MSVTIDKVPAQVLKTLLLPCLSGTDLALSVKRINKQWKKFVESSDPLVARILQSKIEAANRAYPYELNRSIH